MAGTLLPVPDVFIFLIIYRQKMMDTWRIGEKPLFAGSYDISLFYIYPKIFQNDFFFGLIIFRPLCCSYKDRISFSYRS